MDSKLFYLIAADVLLFTHVLVAAFVLFGLIFIFVGKIFSWSSARNPWFRLLHLVTIVIVALQAWLGVICPLTTWEMALRQKAGDAVYAGTFISHWLETILYYHAPGLGFYRWLYPVCFTGHYQLVLGSTRTV